MKFVIFHGAFSNPESNWFQELKEKLEALGQTVIAPRFPVEDWNRFTRKGTSVPSQYQNLYNWMKVFENEVLPKILGKEKICFIGHSLGPVFILHVVDKYNIKLDSAIFVSPFMDELKLHKLWQFDHANKTFYKTDFDFEKLQKLIPVSYVLYSENDPYVEKAHPLLFAKVLGSSIIMVRRAGHLNSEVNLNEFPLVFELCSTRLNLSIYQRYIAHRRELYNLEYERVKPEATIKLKPTEIMDEGVFHFKYLKQEGFCTFPAWQAKWDPRDKYYTDGRRAAKRMKNFIRVFMVRYKKDLKNPKLLDQIKLDIDGSIKVFLCLLDKEIEGKVKDLDFGIWDNEYLCVIHYNDNWKKMEEIVLDSRSTNLKKAKGWQKLILNKSVRIYNSQEDIEDFVKRI